MNPGSSRGQRCAVGSRDPLNLYIYIKQLSDEFEHDIMRKPNSIIVLLYIFHIIHPQKQKRSVQPFCF